MSRWRFAGSRIDGETFELDGLNVWAEAWRDTPERTATVLDPIYGQTHHFGVYEIGPAESPIRFAAGEFSNLIWGFYTPA